MKPRIRVPIRRLVEFTLRSGDLDLTTFGSGSSTEAIRAHQEIQASRPKEYASEVHISLEYETEAYVLDISGRIDGVYRYSDETIIDEIKTTKKGIDGLMDSKNPLHWGQVKCYAYVYARLHNLTTIITQLTYYNLDSKQKRESRQSFDIFTLEEFFDSLITKYLEWFETVLEWVQLRNVSIQEMSFPFESKRPGQDDIMVGVEEAISEHGQLLIQAPTGIGKSMAVIYPSIKAIPGGQVSKIFFLTARTTGKATAEDSLAILRGKGLKCKSITLTAKKKVCFNPDKLCNGKECKYARGYYDRINKALLDGYKQDSFSRDVIESLSLEHRVCPFEFSLELSQWVDFITCDYNYVFDPRVYLRRFFQEGMNGYVFLVDEAHNLVDRARAMYSAALDEASLDSLMTRLEDKLPKVHKRLAGLKTWMVDFRINTNQNHEQDTFAEKDPPWDLCVRLKHFTSQTGKWLSLNQHTNFRQVLLEFYFEVQGFLQIIERYDESYATCYDRTDNDLRVKLFCIDPSAHLKEPLQRSNATVFFSGTLSPMHYFIASLGCDEAARTMLLPSPYDSENLCVLIAWNISTLYKHRESTKADVARFIFHLVRQKKENCLIYFPSYQYMKQVVDIFETMDADIDTIVQSPRMTEYERDVYIDRFHQGTGNPVVGFAVLGGVFAESIDLLGERLTGAVIVGVGLPKISLERELIKEYFNQVNGSGFAFSYQIPGMIKVLQAAGRVIRSEHDQGTVLLIGRRYTQDPYRSLMPEEWNPIGVEDADCIDEILQSFWKQKAVYT